MWLSSAVAAIITHGTHNTCVVFFSHREAVLNCYAKEMESVVLMWEHMGEEYSKALAPKLSMDDEKGRSWVKQQLKLFSVCVLKGTHFPVPDPTLS